MIKTKSNLIIGVVLVAIAALLAIWFLVSNRFDRVIVVNYQVEEWRKSESPKMGPMFVKICSEIWNQADGAVKGVDEQWIIRHFGKGGDNPIGRNEENERYYMTVDPKFMRSWVTIQFVNGEVKHVDFNKLNPSSAQSGPQSNNGY